MRGVVFSSLALFALAATAPPALAVAEMASHSAVYDVKLGTVSSSSRIRSAIGQAAYKIQRDCDGWNATENYAVTFGYQNGYHDFLSHYQSWESTDGNSYSFIINEIGINRELRKYTGYAHKTGSNAEAYYIDGEERAVPLPDGTVFPIAYTRSLLRDAGRGAKIASAVLFFGGDEGDDLYNVTSVIGPRRPDGGVARLGGLSEDGYWPLRIAYFEPGSADATPEYEIEFEIQDNGIIRGYRVDYGDFSMRARLREIEALSEPEC